ncbi:MAG: hypothetical protein DMF72_15105 [Acidobacteria bacterium]|nr:MAG: hypothetical protein DMF72_15105 [Acidobacteriota bacterium]
MQNELNVLRDVSERLSKAGIDYMLTGSWALGYYAQPRMTRDIDLVVALERRDAESIIALFEDNYYVPRSAVVRGIANKTLFNIIHSEFIVKIDFIIRKDDEYRRTEFGRRSQVEIQGMKLSIVSKEDLIISKLAWAKDSHSEFQLRDVKSLLEAGYDEAYLTEWTDKLGLTDLLEECIHD